MITLKRAALLVPLAMLLGLLLVQLPLTSEQRLGQLLRLDALAGFMCLLLLLGLALLWSGALVEPRELVVLEQLLLPARWPASQELRAGLLAIGLALAYLTPWLPLLVAGFAVAELVAGRGLDQGRQATHGQRLLRWLPVLLLAMGLGWLAVRGASLRIDTPGLPAFMDSLVFGCVLLAVLLGTGLVPVGSQPATDLSQLLLLRLAWIYPLVRLYELGPWNVGWVLATVLPGGALALWAGWSAPWIAEPWRRAARIQAAAVGGVLGALGVTTEAGLAGALLGLLATLLVSAGLATRRRHPLLVLVLGPVPLALPFVALWLQIGGAVAGGLEVLAAALWLSAIGWTVAALRLLSEGRPGRADWSVKLLAGLSLLAGLLAPLLLRWLITPALVQLGAGISPFGQPAAWPWLGLEVRSVSGATVSSWLALALVALLLLLSAIVYLLLRLLPTTQAPAAAGPAAAEQSADLWALVQQSVPWLPGKDRDGDDR